MVNRGHVPQRLCVGCGQRAARAGLVRFTRGHGAAAGQVVLDPDGGAPGRGVYLCPRLECYDNATGKRRSLQRKLGATATGPELREDFTRLIGG
ncbi:MAG: YlxR family protein [Thermoleophilia bacterium]